MSFRRPPRRYTALPSPSGLAGKSGQTEPADAFKTQRRKSRTSHLGQRETRSTRPTNLPIPITSFVGREGEMSRLRTALRGPGNRFITLTGPMGCGKSRLAIETVTGATDSFPDGIV